MINIFIFIFWFSVFCIAFTYFLYPLLLAVLVLFKRRPVEKREIEPSVSLIITAHNEEKDIARKLEDSLKLDYPKHKLEIIVAADAPTDRTNDIVGEFKGRGVLLVAQEKRLGKTAAQNKAVNAARGDIVVFSDATTHFDKDIIKKLVRNFADKSVGCVGAGLTYIADDRSKLSKVRNIYWSYENFFRRRESALNSLVGVSGCCYAVRKEIYKKLDPCLISDFVITWILFEQGYRSVLEEEAKVYEHVVESERDEINMRTRITSRSITAFRVMKKLLNPLKFGFFSLQLIGHKVLRYFVPLFAIMILASSLVLCDRQPYRGFLYLQLLFFISGAIGFISNNTKSIFYTIYYFTFGNYSVLKGLLKSADGHNKCDMWQPFRHKHTEGHER